MRDTAPKVRSLRDMRVQIGAVQSSVNEVRASLAYHRFLTLESFPIAMTMRPYDRLVRRAILEDLRTERDSAGSGPDGP